MSLSPECLSRLGLRQPPFADPPGESFVYTDPLLESLGDSAIRALAMPGAILLLTGEDGAGRSLQLMRLLGLVADRFDLIAFRARGGIGFDSVEATIRQQLHVERAPPLAGLLGARIREGRIPLIAIDDAHRFGGDILPRLLRLRHEVLEAEGRGPRLLLVGDPEFGERRLPLTDPEDEQQVTRLALRAFNREQTWAYLRHRLSAAGHPEPDLLLTPAALDALLREGRGLPALLNAAAATWLERLCEPEPESSLEAARSLAARLAALTPPAAAAAPPPDMIAPPPPVAPPPRPIPVWNRRWFIPALVGGALAATLIPVILQLSDRDRPVHPLLSAGPDTQPPPVPAVPAPPPVAPPASPAPEAAAPAESGAAATPPEPAAPATPPVAPVPAGTPPLVVIQPPPAVPEPAVPPPVEDAAPDAGSAIDWLKSQDPRAFTIQLVAARNLAAARAHVEPHQLEGVRYIQTRTFMVALLGSYPTQAAAQQAVRALPAPLRADPPWVRTIGSVRNVLP